MNNNGITVKKGRNHFQKEDFKRGILKIHKNVKPFEKLLSRIGKFLGRMFLIAVLFTVMGHYVPELKEQLPSLYQLIDLVLRLMEWMSAILLQFIQQFI
jgi:hypothetical protein